MDLRHSLRLAMLLTLLPLSNYAGAELTLGIGHSSEYSDNADLAEDNTHEHREDRTWLDLGLELDRKQWLLATQYQFTNVHFDSNSPTPQPDNDEITGRTDFNGLWLKRRLQLDASHARQNFLGTPGDLELQRNLQARDTASISPRLYLQNNSRQQAYLSGQYSSINYDENASTQLSVDSETSGWSAGFNRKISAVTLVGIEAQELTTTYETDAPDTDFTRLSVFYDVSLRRLQYSLALGYNKSSSDLGDDNESPMALLNLSYDSGKTQISLDSQYFLTDTARGNQSFSGLDQSSANLSLGNGNSSQVDRYELLNNRLQISTQLNARWGLSVNVSAAEQTYETNPELDQTTYNYQISLTNSISSHWQWSLEARQQVLEASDPEATIGYQTDTYRLRVDYQATESLSLQLDLQSEDRNGDNGGRSYKEQTAELSLIYQLRP